MSHTDYQNHIRMKKDKLYEDQDGNPILLKAGEPIDVGKNLAVAQINALVLSLEATDNPDDHNLYRGKYNPLKTYYTPETVTINGTTYDCIQDTPSPAGAFDATKWEAQVGVHYNEAP